MPKNTGLLAEFDNEMISTRAILARVPLEKGDWRPHAKSMSMGQLATHIARLVGWISLTLTTDSFEVNGPDPRPLPTTQAELLALFDETAAAARATLAAVSDEELMKPWSLIAYGKTIFTMPRIAVLRSFVMNHLIHHRAQLGVYLRINDIPLPMTYGPSADETMM